MRRDETSQFEVPSSDLRSMDRTRFFEGHNSVINTGGLLYFLHCVYSLITPHCVSSCPHFRPLRSQALLSDTCKGQNKRRQPSKLTVFMPEISCSTLSLQMLVWMSTSKSEILSTLKIGLIMSPFQPACDHTEPTGDSSRLSHPKLQNLCTRSSAQDRQHN